MDEKILVKCDSRNANLVNLAIGMNRKMFSFNNLPKDISIQFEIFIVSIKFATKLTFFHFFVPTFARQAVL